MAHQFEVDADSARVGHGEEHQVIRMAEIEAEGRGDAFQFGFAVRSLRETEVAGLQVEVAAEDRAKQSAPGDKAAAIPFKMEALGADPFS